MANPVNLGVEGQFNCTPNTIYESSIKQLSGQGTGNGCTLVCNHAMSIKRPQDANYCWWTSGPAANCPDGTLVKMRATTPNAFNDHVDTTLAYRVNGVDTVIWTASFYTIIAGLPYEPAHWNFEPVVSENGTYNYACDLKRRTPSFPGRGSGQQASMGCSAIGDGMVRDGMTRVSTTLYDSGYYPDPSDGTHIVALRSFPGPPPSDRDYLCLRRDANGNWSYKAGSNPITNVDQSGNLITDPRTGDFGKYIDFCGFFKCVPALMTIL